MRELEQHHIDALREIQEIIHANNVEAGWYTDLATGEPKKRNFGEVVALMHSELSEALEAWRKGMMDNHLPHRRGVEVEFADGIIRVLDTCGAMQLDVAGAMAEKLIYNAQRADHKLENRREAGGKRI